MYLLDGGVILPGTVVGDNVVIGAYAVVTGKLEPNSVYAGNPARRICSVEDFIQKRENNQLFEAVDIFKKYYLRFGKTPDKAVFHEYFYLFSSDSQLIDIYKNKMAENGNYKQCLNYLKKHKPMFENYELFCKYAKAQIKQGERL